MSILTFLFAEMSKESEYLIGNVTELQLNSILTLILVVVGILLCCYALYVEIRIQKAKRGRDSGGGQDYVAACDINDRVSCTRALESKYARGLGILPENSPLSMSNAVYGLVFYGFLIVVGIVSFYYEDSVWVGGLLLASLIVVNLTDVYLAYILFFVLKDVCVVCISWYSVNLTLLGLAIWRCRAVF